MPFVKTRLYFSPVRKIEIVQIVDYCSSYNISIITQIFKQHFHTTFIAKHHIFLIISCNIIISYFHFTLALINIFSSYSNTICCRWQERNLLRKTTFENSHALHKINKPFLYKYSTLVISYM